MMKNTVIFGGTFNPPHSGHKQMLSAVCSLESTNKVIVMPAGVPPHKVCEELAGNEDRLNMCRIAFGGEKNVFVSDSEMRRTGKSYTVDTLKALQQNGEKNLAIVCGGDMIATFSEWYRYEDILKMAEIIAIRRCGTDNEKFDEAVKELIKKGGKITVLEINVTDISSTEIRNNIKNKEYLLEYLSKGVYDYITEKGLYGE